MAGLNLRGDTSGSVEIVSPAVAGDNTITLPNDNGSANQFFKNSTTAGIVTHSSMVEDASGNIGIGTTTPTETLHVVGDARITGILTIGTASVTLNGTDGIITGINTINGLTYPSAGSLSNRNMIINGAMQLAQRSTSATGVTATGYHAVDRFEASITTMGTYTISQSTDAPDGFANSLKYEVTTADASPAAADQIALQTKFEGQNLQHLNYGSSSAKSLTLSFWVKSDVTGTYSNEFRQPDNSSKHYSFSYTINAADTWEHKTVTIPGDASGVINNDNGNGFDIKWWLGAGSNFTSGTYTTGSWKSRTVANTVSSSSPNFASTVGNEWYITGVQLEVGERVTPFEHRTYGDELLKCQRYYAKVGGSRVTGGGGSSTAVTLVVSTPAEMRTTPDVEDVTINSMVRYDGTGAGNLGSATGAVGTSLGSMYSVNISNLTSVSDNRAYFSNCSFNLDAEL